MRNIDHYLALPYQQTVTLEECSDGSPCYVARVIELPGCASHGDTPDQALENLEDAKRNLPTILGHEAHGFREVFPEGRIHRPNPYPLR